MISSLVINNRTISLFLLFSIFLFTGCGATTSTRSDEPIVAKVLQTGVIKCFEPSRPSSSDKSTCELSAVARVGKALIFANDKPIMANSAIFSVPFNGHRVMQERSYFKFDVITNAIKFEGMTVTPDGSRVIVTTAFDRYSKDKPDSGYYNTLLSWPLAVPNQANIIGVNENEDILSSILLRDKFLQVLREKDNRINYFKIEGLSAIPDNKILFGIREVGTSYKDSRYVIKLIEAKYSIENNRIQIKGDFKLVYEFNPVSYLNNTHKLGLSSVEYDKVNDRLYILTSFEENDKPEGIGAYLWAISLSDMQMNKEPTLVLNTGLKPFMFSHKAEGLAILDNNQLLVIHDDDRIITRLKLDGDLQERNRALNESVFNILQIQ